MHRNNKYAYLHMYTGIPSQNKNIKFVKRTDSW